MESKRTDPIRILMVEDNLGDILLLTEAIKAGQLKAQVRALSTAEEALEYLRGEGKYPGEPIPDLIFLDLNLPRMDGRSLLRRIKADPVFRSTPVIVLSGSSLETDIREAYDMNANCYLIKPKDLDEFKKLTRSLKDFWFSLVQLPDRKRALLGGQN